MSIASEVEFKFPQIRTLFASGEDFVDAIRFLYSEESDLYLHNLLTFPDSVIILSQPFFRFSLKEGFALASNNQTILRDSPYSIYDSKGEFLYSISDHNYVFGNAVLDRSLLLNSYPLAQYFIQYQTFVGPRTLLLIINNLYERRATESNVFSQSKPAVVRTEQVDRVRLLITDGYRDNSSNLIKATVNFLKSSPAEISSANVILSNPLAEKTFFDQKFDLYLRSSGWLVFSQDNNLLSLSSLTGIGQERLIQFKPFLYYFVNRELDLNAARNFFLLNPVNNPSPYSDISANLIRVL